ncbi:MAG: DUF2341 domain-containing protein, partial [Bacteroidetes bacterium]|nr:DUF2341 domain-containing protein [Bacteroidota bacterium]
MFKKASFGLYGFLLTVASINSVQAQWLSGYTNRKAIIIQGSKITGSLTNFPLLINHTDADLKHTSSGGKVKNTNGYDIRFTNSDGTTLLNHQIESYTSSSGNLVAWVNIPSLSAGTNKTIYIYFGNSSVGSSTSTTAAWNSGFDAVYHLDVANTTDGTPNGRTSTLTGSSDVTGKIAGGQNFPGAGNNMNCNFTGGSTFTWSTWVNWNTLSGFQTAMAIATNYQLMDMNGADFNHWASDGPSGNTYSTTSLSSGTWYLFTLVRTGNSTTNGYKFYLNGTLKGQANTGTWSPGSNIFLATRPGVGQDGNLRMDEVQISNVARDSAWNRATFNTQNASLGSFYTLGSLQFGGTPVILNPFTNLPLVNKTLRVNVNRCGVSSDSILLRFPIIDLLKPDRDSINRTLLKTATKGTIKFYGDTSFRYIPNSGSSGFDTIRFQVNDTATTTNPTRLFDTAWVIFNIGQFPDATGKIISISKPVTTCDANVLFRIYNRSRCGTLPSSTPYRIYLGDPRTGAVSSNGSGTIGTAINAGDSLSLSLSLNSYGLALYFVLNDNGSASTPYVPTVTFTGGGVTETDYTNNFILVDTFKSCGANNSNNAFLNGNGYGTDYVTGNLATYCGYTFGTGPGFGFSFDTYEAPFAVCYISYGLGGGMGIGFDMNKCFIANCDQDDDNDGIPDVVEICGAGATEFTCQHPNADHDCDGVPNYQDPDFCTLNSKGVCASMDKDNDGIIASLDLDSDNDGIPDIIETGGTDINGDGIADNVTDANGNGIPDIYDTKVIGGVAIANLDSDGDGIPNVFDLDSDNDGIPDIVESGGADDNNDGMVDTMRDTDNDGFSNLYDSDTDNNGTIDNAQVITNGLVSAGPMVRTGADVNADGKPDSYLVQTDKDGDGKLNGWDIDADNDGIVDILEVGGTDANKDGRVDSYSDSDGDGWNNAQDGTTSGTPWIRPYSDINNDGYPDLSSGNPWATDNTDADRFADFLDIDADNDGITDNTEAQRTAAYIPPSGVDTDGDGLDNAYDPTNSGTYITPVNTDGTDNPDYTDLNSDNDYQSDLIEGHDSDNDGIADSGSPASTGIGGSADVDLDGLLDGFDNNTSSTDPTNSGLSPSSFPLLDGGVDRDWRDSLALTPNFLYAYNDINQTLKNVAVSGQVLTNDEDPEGNIMTVTTTPLANPVHGSVTLNSNGTYTYTPAANYVGNDSFRYRVCDNGS